MHNVPFRIIRRAGCYELEEWKDDDWYYENVGTYETERLAWLGLKEYLQATTIVNITKELILEKLGIEL